MLEECMKCRPGNPSQRWDPRLGSYRRSQSYHQHRKSLNFWAEIPAGHFKGSLQQAQHLLLSNYQERQRGFCRNKRPCTQCIFLILFIFHSKHSSGFS